MRGNEYQKLAMRTNDGKCTDRLLRAIEKAADEYGMDVGGVFNACLGLSGESGEAEDMIKKWIFQEMPLDTTRLKKEIGDVLWYVAQMCHSFGWEMEEMMEMNIEKLRIRYPNGFDPKGSMERVDEAR
jgi:NTP pyrophosphatase (non-canonical NTP hydrolase)